MLRDRAAHACEIAPAHVSMVQLPKFHDAALWSTRSQLPSVSPGSLLPLAEQAAAALRASRATVSVFEATTGGLINAALQSAPGASAFTTCGAVTYSSRKGAPVLGDDFAPPAASDADAYVASKQAWTQGLARAKRLETGATWCVAESGACGPTFHHAMGAGFSAVFISGPVERGVLFRSAHAQREPNMWAFAKAALDLLAEAIAAAAPEHAAEGEAGGLLVCREDRYGGVEAEVLPEAAARLSQPAFARELAAALVGWQAQGKQGIWLKLPTECAACVPPAVACGFAYHHAKPGYALLTRWLPAHLSSPLPAYAFTQIGVGGVVLNAAGQVLMVQERVSPLALYQDSWKLPGGLADPVGARARPRPLRAHVRTRLPSSRLRPPPPSLPALRPSTLRTRSRARCARRRGWSRRSRGWSLLGTRTATGSGRATSTWSCGCACQRGPTPSSSTRASSRARAGCRARRCARWSSPTRRRRSRAG